jgi:hypothetical protein
LAGDLGFRLDFFAAYEGVERNPALRVGVQGHPFPHLAVADARGNDDLVLDSPRTRVDQLAGLVVGQVEGIGGGDHRIAVEHEARVQRPCPKDCAVVTVDAHQGVQHGVLVRVRGP